MNNQIDELQRLLAMYWPAHSDVLGKSTTRRLAECILAGDRPEQVFSDVTDGGAPFDLKDTLTLVGHALVFIKLVLDIYKLLAERSKTKPSAQSVEQMVRERADSEIQLILGSDRGRAVIQSVAA